MQPSDFVLINLQRITMNIETLFSSVLPQEQIIPERDYSYAATTGHVPTILGVLKPTSQDEIQKIVTIAQRENIKLYPISSGKNWGYSDGLPVSANNLIVDLSLMNKIHEYNPDLGYITLEPGVTQQQLSDFLYANGDLHIMSPTGSSPQTTIIGNYLERGFGIAPHMDHASAVTHLRAVLGDGSLYEPVLTQLGCTQIDKLYKHGLGAYTDGLFFQSGLGIVTQMSIKLSRRAAASLVVIAEAREGQMSAIVESLRGLRQRWDTPSLSMKLFNAAYIMAASGVPYPEDLLAKNQAIDAERLRDIATKNDIAPYSIIVTVTGPKALTRGIAKDLKRALKPQSKKYIPINEGRYALMQKIKAFLPQNMRQKIEPLTSLWGFMHGQPSENILSFAYWRSGKTPPPNMPIDPARDGCGLIWYAPIIPMTPDAVKGLEALLQDVCPQYGITPAYNFTNYADSYFVVLTALIYARDIGADSAQNCYLHLMEEGIKRGFAPYRAPNFAMERLYDGVTPLGALISQVVDSKGTISPVRYG
jgi:4-cresol dehydrogenase (hydroxylating)